MTLEERRRYLISSQKKKNWFDLSKVTLVANDVYSANRAYGYKDGEKLISNYGQYAIGTYLYDSRTILPKGDYTLSFTVYAPSVHGLRYRVAIYESNSNITRIAQDIKWDLPPKVYKDYTLSFSLSEEATVVIGMQGVGDASNYLTMKYEFTNIRIEKVG